MVVWSSSFHEMDAAFLKLRPKADGEPKAEPLRLHERAMAMAEPTPRMYIIGHPAGRDLELSLQDNLLVASNDTLLHYRTPTEPGSCPRQPRLRAARLARGRATPQGQPHDAADRRGRRHLRGQRRDRHPVHPEADAERRPRAAPVRRRLTAHEDRRTPAVEKSSSRTPTATDEAAGTTRLRERLPPP